MAVTQPFFNIETSFYSILHFAVCQLQCWPFLSTSPSCSTVDPFSAPRRPRPSSLRSRRLFDEPNTERRCPSQPRRPVPEFRNLWPFSAGTFQRPFPALCIRYLLVADSVIRWPVSVHVGIVVASAFIDCSSLNCLPLQQRQQRRPHLNTYDEFVCVYCSLKSIIYVNCRG